MKKQVRRLIIAFLMSFACFAATTIWYRWSSRGSLTSGNQKPIAFVEKAKDEIHRRPVTRIIWQLISDGEPVYPGEAIRTSSAGEVRIQFAENSRFIDLEPDSLIVITQSGQNEISLDLLDGSAMVNQGKASMAGQDAAAAVSFSAPVLTLKTGSAKIDLTKATATLSKGSGNTMSLRVLEGQAKVEDAKGISKELSTGSVQSLGAVDPTFDLSNLQILSPALDQTFSFDPQNPRPVLFSWKGFPENATVALHLGPSRKNLKAETESQGDPISRSLPSGRHYWKLVAKQPGSSKIWAETPVYKLEVVPRSPPTLISPQANEKILKSTSTEQKVEFRWLASPQTEKVKIEVARDPAMKNKIVSQDVTNTDQWSQAFGEGDYWVRLSAHYEPASPEVTSSIQKFTLSAKPAPQPVAVRWESPTAKAPAYFVDQPQAHLRWAPVKPEVPVKVWKLRWASSETDFLKNEGTTQTFTQPEAQLKFDRADRYFAKVEGFDEEDQIVAISEVVAFEVTPLPLLPAPALLAEPGDLLADNQGQLELKWNEIPGAQEYKIILYDEKGQEKRATKLKRTSTTLVNLLPGQHQVEVQAIDVHGRASVKMEPRMVRVPASSGLSSPKFKKMKVN